MTTYEILEKALALIEREENWCGDNPTGEGPNGSLCAVNAIRMTTDGTLGDWSDAALAAHKALAAPLNGVVVSVFNDTHTHAKVVALFQRAIRAEKEKVGIPFDLPEPVVTSPEKAEVHA